MLLQGKNAIVTGARTGIGLATVEKFASEGANVWAVVHREDPAFLDTINRLSVDNNVWIKPVYVDLLNPDEITDGIKSIIQEKQSIDILVNAAGIVSPNRLFTMTSMSDIKKVMDVNFFSVLHIIQLVTRVMQRQKSGSIINIASISAWGEDTSQIEYAASKAAIVIATKKLARELGIYGIRVNAVAPGLTETKMLSDMSEEAISDIKKGMAFHRLGKPEEIANVINFLATDDASYITGETIKVDGGGNDLRLRIS